MDDDALDPTLWRTFQEEAGDLLGRLELALLALEGESDAAQVDEVFRCAHTLKGASGSAGAPAMTSLAHAMEESLDRIRRGSAAPESGTLTRCLAAVDRLRALLAAPDLARAAPTQEDAALAASLTDATETPGAPSSAEAGRAPGAVRAAAATPATPSLRVGVDRFDRMATQLGELFVARNRLGELIRRGATQGELLAAHEHAGRRFDDLQEMVTRLRAVPLGPVMRQHARTVRDAARALDKQAMLLVQGDDVEVDFAIVDGLRDPLMHLVRNAVAHGIEDPMARIEAGKSPGGMIELTARRDGGFVEVTVADDGRGLDRARILAKARERGRAVADSLSDEAVFRFIFEPGFSTAAGVSSVAGRGVGMDVVMRDVLALRGSIDVRSTPGEGAAFVLRMPLSLSVVHGFGVGVGGELYILPMACVVECVALPEAARGAQPTGMIVHRGRTLPFARLRALYDVPESPRGAEVLVLLRHDGVVFGLVVDELLGAAEHLVKPLTVDCALGPGVMGTTLLGDGRVALAVDVPQLFRATLLSTREAA